MIYLKQTRCFLKNKNSIGIYGQSQDTGMTWKENKHSKNFCEQADTNFITF